MPEEGSERFAWVRPLIYAAGGVGAVAAAVGGYNAHEGDSGKSTFSMDERIALERRISGLETKVERFDQIVAGGREEMSNAARKRIESSEADISQLERRVRDLEERVGKIERKVP